MSITTSILAWRIPPAMSVISSPAPYESNRSPNWRSQRESPSAPRVGQATLYELIEREHSRLQNLFKRIQKVSSELARERLLHEIAQELTLHEQFEEQVFYPLVREKLGMNAVIIEQVSGGHVAIQKLLNQLLMVDSATNKWRNLVANLSTVTIQHIHDEENNVLPAARDVINAQDAYVLGRQYEQMKEITIFVSSLVDRITRTLPASLAEVLEIRIDTISPTSGISTGYIELSLNIKNSLLYSHISLLCPVISGVLQPLSRRGLDASIVLCYDHKAYLAFLASPNPDYLFVENDFDPSSLRTASSDKDADITSFKDLAHFLQRNTCKITNSPSSIEKEESLCDPRSTDGVKTPMADCKEVVEYEDFAQFVSTTRRATTGLKNILNFFDSIREERGNNREDNCMKA